MFSSKEVKKFIVTYGRRIFFPSLENKLTSTIVIAGIGIITLPAPFKVIFYNWIIEFFNINSIAPVTLPDVSSGSADYLWGVLLIIIGLTFNITRFGLEFVKSERNHKKVRDGRIALLKQVRNSLSIKGLTNKQFRNSIEYSQIKEHLSPEAIISVEGTHTKGAFSREVVVVVAGETRNSGANPFKNKILDEISQLERDWIIL